MKIRHPEFQYQILPYFPLGTHYGTGKWHYKLAVTINLSSEDCLKLLVLFKEAHHREEGKQLLSITTESWPPLAFMKCN